MQQRRGQTIKFADNTGTLTIGSQASLPTENPILISVFQKGDAIYFAGQNLTLGYSFQNDKQLQSGATYNTVTVFSGNNPVGVLSFDDPSIINQLEPITVGNGTEIIEDPNAGNPVNNPPGNQIDWAFVQKNEGGLWYSPYVVPNSRGGVTVGAGVDLGRGPVNNATAFATIFPNYQNDPNLFEVYKYYLGKTGSGGTDANGNPYGTDALVALENTAPGEYDIVGGDPTSTSASLDYQQAEALTVQAETKIYGGIFNGFNNAVVKLLTNLQIANSSSASSPTSYFNTLPPDVQTALTDYAYNAGAAGLINQTSIWTDALAWSLADVEANPIGKNDAITQMQSDFISLSLKYNGAREDRLQADARLLSNDFTAGPVIIPAPETATTSATTEPTIFSEVVPVISTVGKYFFDPSGYSTYTLSESAGSPNFASVQMPPEDDATDDEPAAYRLSYDVGGVSSSPVILQPDQTLSLPAGVDGLTVTQLDSSGDPIASSDEFSFFVTFASTGTFTGALTETSPTDIAATTPTTPTPNPAVTAPAAEAVTAGGTAAFAGVSVSDPSSVGPADALVLTVTTSAGTIAMTGAGGNAVRQHAKLWGLFGFGRLRARGTRVSGCQRWCGG